jgi:hypothetical protein
MLYQHSKINFSTKISSVPPLGGKHAGILEIRHLVKKRCAIQTRFDIMKDDQGRKVKEGGKLGKVREGQGRKEGRLRK